MTNLNSKKGDRNERTIVNCLDALGFAVMRAPSSGSATKRELPDVLAGRKGLFYAVEAKRYSSERVYIDAREVKDLNHFGEMFGAKSRIAVRFDLERGDPAWGDGMRYGAYLWDPADLYQTDSGNYRVDRETTLAEATPMYDIEGADHRSALEQVEF